MKKLLILFSIILFLIQSRLSSQTLTSNSSPAFGDIFRYQNCSYQTPGSPGLNQLWNFSTAVKSSITQIQFTYNHDTGLDFCTPGWLVGLKSGLGSMFSSYAILANTTGLFFTGAWYQPIPTICYSNSESLITYPFIYGNTFIDTWAGATVASLTPYHNISGTTTVTADGTGTLVTPAGTYTNVLRIHYTKIYQDIAAGTTPTTTNYQEESYYWFHPSIHGEIMRVSEITSPALTPTQTLAYRDDAPVGLPDQVLENESFLIYPNPAIDKLFISFNKNYGNEIEVVILNTFGQEVFRHNFNHGKLFSVDLSSISSGTYFIRIYSEQKPIGQQKLMILK